MKTKLIKDYVEYCLVEIKKLIAYYLVEIKNLFFHYIPDFLEPFIMMNIVKPIFIFLRIYNKMWIFYKYGDSSFEKFIQIMSDIIEYKKSKKKAREYVNFCKNIKSHDFINWFKKEYGKESLTSLHSEENKKIIDKKSSILPNFFSVYRRLVCYAYNKDIMKTEDFINKYNPPASELYYYYEYLALLIEGIDTRVLLGYETPIEVFLAAVSEDKDVEKKIN
jgi:hypothetical protein